MLYEVVRIKTLYKFISLFILLQIYFVPIAYTIEIQKRNPKEYIIGIDVSHYQGNIDWHKVHIHPVDFTYIKASEGLDKIDPKFSYNWHRAHKVGIPVGAYHFFDPIDDPRAQARLFIELLKLSSPQNSMLPPVLDVEITKQMPIAELIANIKLWLELVEDAIGCRPTIYTNLYLWNNYFNDAFKDYKLWVAQYNDALDLNPHNNLIMWQYTQFENIEGIIGKVDKSRFFGDYIELDNLKCNPW